MPRGRARARSIGRHGSSKRASHPSASGLPVTSLQPPAIGLRRSARLVESARRRQITSSTDDSMTDVAQRRLHAESLNARSLEADIVQPPTHRTAQVSSEDQARATRKRTQNGNSTPNVFSLEPIDQPPDQIRAGIPLGSPYTLRVDLLREFSSSGSLDRDRGRLMAVATLIAADSNASSTPIGQGILTGPRLADTVHPTHSTGTLGEVSFPDLAILSVGIFRIRVTLLRMNIAAHAGVIMPGLQGATSLASFDSEPIIVAGS